MATRLWRKRDKLERKTKDKHTEPTDKQKTDQSDKKWEPNRTENKFVFDKKCKHWKKKWMLDKEKKKKSWSRHQTHMRTWVIHKYMYKFYKHKSAHTHMYPDGKKEKRIEKRDNE